MEEQNNAQTPEMTSPTISTNNFAVPIAIVIAGLAIAIAVYFGDNKEGLNY